MKDVFLLGAGFSRAVSPKMPLLADLPDELRSRMRELLPTWLKRLSKVENVEFWLTYLSQPQPWLSEADILRNRALFLDLTKRLADLVDEHTLKVVGSSCPDWLRKLVDYWHREHSAVITLNYDTLIERAASRVSLGEKLPLATAHLYPLPFTESLSIYLRKASR